MRVFAIATVCLLSLVGPAAADDEKKEEPRKAPPKPLTAEQAADKVLEAVKAKEQDALKAFAKKDNPDPWLVADELCYRGDHDAAEVFAKAVPRADVQGLLPYVAAWPERQPDKAERQLLARMNAAILARRLQEVIEGTAALPGSLDTVVRIRLSHIRGVALRLVRQFHDSASMLRAAADAASVLGWLSRAASLYHEAGKSAYGGSDWAHTVEFWGARVALEERRGNKAGAAVALGNIGIVHHRLGEYAKAREIYERAVAAMEAVGDRAGASLTLNNLGAIHQRLGDYARALATYGRALAIMEALGDKARAAGTLGNIGNVHQSLGDFPRALATHERALEQLNALGAKANAADTLGNIGLVYKNLGEYAKALGIYERALAAKEALGNKSGAAETLGNIGNIHKILGSYAKSLAIHERVLEAMEALGHKAGVAKTLGNIANVHQILGDHAKALAAYERVLAVMEALGSKAGAALALGHIGSVHRSLGEYEKALAMHERALVAWEALGNKAGAATTLGHIGIVYQSLGDYAKALAVHERALAAKEALGDQTGAARTRANMGIVHAYLRNDAKALRLLKRAASTAHSLRATSLRVSALEELARLHLTMGKPSQALARAREALRETESLLEGLGEEQGAVARERYADLFAMGTVAAMHEEDAAEAVRFLESGRAGAQRDSLDRRDVLRWKAVSLPPDLLRADREAHAAQSIARHGYDRAVKRRKRTEIRAATKTLDNATAVVGEVAERIQRKLKQQAWLFYPRAKTIYDIQDALDADQALVLYGLCVDEALALVLRQDGERIVSLGKIADAEAACAALDASNADVDPAKALAALKAMLVDPLKLGKDVKQVMVSPEGPLCYLPFGALFEQTVAMTPSGTTHLLLLDEEREAGTGMADSLSKRSGDSRDDLRRRPVAEALAGSIVE